MRRAQRLCVNFNAASSIFRSNCTHRTLIPFHICFCRRRIHEFHLFLDMATSVSVSALPIRTTSRPSERGCRQLGRSGSSRVSFFRSNGLPLSSLPEYRVEIGYELGFCSERDSALTKGRRGAVVKAQEKDEGGAQVDDEKPFYAGLEFWIQVAVVILTFGFVDAGYSGDWSRIGALSPETEAQLRVAAYAVVPFSAAVVWATGKRKNTS